MGRLSFSMLACLRRLAIVCGIGAAMCGASPASAAAPERFPFDFRDAFTDTETCAAEPWGFDLEATEHAYGFTQVYSDRDGNFVRAIVHLNLDFTISANGLTLIERDQITEIHTQDGRREIGLWTHIQGPDGGIVLRDAGQLVFGPDDTFLYARGPHPQFFGASFCDALVP
jgi:hypothetical protein